MSIDDKKIAEAIAARMAQRRKAFENGIKVGEEAKNRGNEWYKAGDYERAAQCYKIAMGANVTEAIYYSNMAAAMIKLEEYEEAEGYAFMALLINPRHLKARYRRLRARKAMERYDSALYDAQAMLRIEKECYTAKVEIKTLKRLSRLRSPSWSGEDDDDDTPNEITHKYIDFDPEDLTDSEDSGHSGNNVPCRFYNHEGCYRGLACAFSHSPDDLSTRDRLGKNVCVFFLLGICKFGDAKCNYSHPKVALPPVGWWTDPKEKAEVAQELKEQGMSGRLKARLLKPKGLDLPSMHVHAKRNTPSGRRTGKETKRPPNNGKSCRKRRTRTQANVPRTLASVMTTRSSSFPRV